MFALGKLPARPKPTDFKLEKYEIVKFPTPSSPFGFGTAYPDWKMLGNDRYGDCVLAGGAHETMLWTKVHQGLTPASFDDKHVLADYGAVTGFDPNTGANDNGTDVHAAMSYRRATGLGDASGKRHKIDAYISFNPGDWDELMRATFAFGAVGIGFNFPSSAFKQFDQGVSWSVVQGDSIEGGHYVPIVGSMNTESLCTCITWGKRQQMTRAFYETYNDEAWAMVSLEVVHAGVGLRHLDLQTLRDDLASLR
jgi:hypothetical protein